MQKKILLGICGGIAAYKSPELLRLLQDAGYELRCVVTQSALQFVTELTLQTASHHRVYRNLFDLDQEQQMSHIALARWADVILVAPATANCLAKLAQGFADDLLSAVCLAAMAPIIVAPAMNTKMWENSATQHNIHILKSRNFKIIEPEFGLQACGEVGLGRMAEPINIARVIQDFFQAPINFANKAVLISAGPTREAIDPVRYISNRSSGKMGYAMAEAFNDLGAQVSLISGPVSLSCSDKINLINVTSADEMRNAVLTEISKNELFICAAAVADYRVKKIFQHKIKKTNEDIILELIKNPDILAEVGRLPKRPFLVGFAAETENLELNAQKKLKEKNCDLVIANLVGFDQGFDSDINEVLLVSNNQVPIKMAGEKVQIAKQLAAHLIGLFEKQQNRCADYCGAGHDGEK